MVTVTSQQCKHCERVLPLDSFMKDKTYKNGHTRRCRDCHNEYQTAWRARNPQKFKKAVIKYRTSKPSTHQRSNAGRRARKRAAGVFRITNKETSRLYSSACSNCGSFEKVEADHIIPLSRGGRHSIGNLQPLCKPCNVSKRDRLQVEWRYAERK